MLHCGQTHSLRIHISWICTTLPSWILVGQVWIYTEPVPYEIEIFLDHVKHYSYSLFQINNRNSKRPSPETFGKEK